MVRRARHTRHPRNTARRSVRPGLEPLEHRLTPAVLPYNPQAPMDPGPPAAAVPAAPMSADRPLVPSDSVEILWEGQVRYAAPGEWLAKIDGLPGDTRQVQLAAARALLA